MLGVVTLVVALTGASPAECREMSIAQGNGGARSAMMCKDKDGVWREAGSAPVTSPKPAIPMARLLPTRAKIVSSGTWTVDAHKKMKLPGRIDWGTPIDVLGSLKAERSAGAISVSLIIDGNRATATTFDTTGGMTPTTLSGSYVDGRCSLVDRSGVESWTGTCGPEGLSMEVASTSINKLSYKGRLDTRATQVVDLDLEAEQQRAAQAKAAEDRRLAEQREAAEFARMKAAIPRAVVTKYQPMLERAVAQDSQFWAMNRFKSGSVDIFATKADAKTGVMFLKARFQYSGGTQSWVGAMAKGTTVKCLTFPDDPQGCRPIGGGVGRSMKDSMQAEMYSPVQDHQSSGCDASCRDYRSFQLGQDAFNHYHPQ